MFDRSHLSFIKTPDVIIRETSNGTRYAIAKSTELKAIEKKQPEMICQMHELKFVF